MTELTNKWKCAPLQEAVKGGKEGCCSRVIPEELALIISIYEPGSRLEEMAEIFTRTLHHFNCSKVEHNHEKNMM